LKKRTKKLLSTGTRARTPGTRASERSLFASFSSEKEGLAQSLFEISPWRVKVAPAGGDD
jgi:hypothetical protein